MYKTRIISILILAITILIAIGVIDCCSTAYAAYLGDDHGTFDTFYQKNIGVWGWVGIGTAVVIGVVITIYTAGSGTPAWCTAVGTWIGGTMGLSGAAATSAGLALLGGGSLAAGGFGMAGGVALLTAVSTFGTELIVGYSIERALNTYSDKKFAEECRNMLHLPCPVNTKGGKAYYTAQQYIEEHLDKEKLISEGNNPQVIQEACTLMNNLVSKDTDEMKRMKNETMSALLYWLQGNPQKAVNKANSAILIANQWNDNRWKHNFKATPTIAEFILAVCNLELGKIENNSTYFEYAVLQEPNNKLIPLLFGIYLDRLMILYHYEKAGIYDVACVIGTAKHESVSSHAPIISTILAARILMEIKRLQQDILVVTDTPDDSIRQIDNVEERLREKHKRYKELVDLGRYEILPMLALHDKNVPKDSQFRCPSVQVLLDQYVNDAGNLEMKIAAFGGSNTEIQQQTPQKTQKERNWLLECLIVVLFFALAGYFYWRSTKRTV